MLSFQLDLERPTVSGASSKDALSQTFSPSSVPVSIRSKASNSGNMELSRDDGVDLLPELGNAVARLR